MANLWRFNVLASFAFMLPCVCTTPSAYGGEPWVSWWGSPAAPPSAVVASAYGTARFTVLSPSLIRCETAPDARFEDARTLVVWNRNLTVPPFTAHTVGPVTTIDTGAVLLTYTDDRAPFSDGSLRIERRSGAVWANASNVWVPSRTPGVDPGNLFGTFHTLDSGLNGWVGLNCSKLDPNAFVEDTVDFFPCDFGLLSTTGFSTVDDSRSPVWDDASGWLRTQDKAVCGPPAEGTSCFPGGFDTTNSPLCAAAGCCSAFDGASPLSLWYSADRDDHFSDDKNCSACSGSDGYTYLHVQAALFTEPSLGRVPLNLYWNANPLLLHGTGGDNVASSFPPTQPGYAFARVEGYIYDPNLPQPPETVVLKVYYSHPHLDHYTTASAADEADAMARGYTFVGVAGFAPPPPNSPPAHVPFSCYAPRGHEDIYVFAHGRDFDSALRDYVSIAGQVPIPQRHWMGTSWSRWDEANTAAATLSQVANLTAAGFPLDTYIFDMQWHHRPAWGGYEWDSVRYPDPAALLSTLHAQGLALGMNLHDADGVTAASNPQLWRAFATAMGVDPSSAGVSFAIANKTYADALQRVMIAPLQAQGLDMLWTDFQQGFPGVESVRGLNPTALLNHYRFHNASRSVGLRGTQHSRYAGRGDHRHTSAFGGDVDQSWGSLEYMIYFTATAANAPQCWWGQEMMRQGSDEANTELFVRVNQFGAWSPIFTSWGNVGSNNNWWEMAAPAQDALRTALLDRAALLPVRYSLAARAHESGRCPYLPMYRLYTDEAAAYGCPGQYMLGDDILIAPAFAPMSTPAGGGNASTPVSVWLPPGGPWFEWEDANVSFESGQWISTSAPLSRVPVFVRAGAVLALLPRRLLAVPGMAARQYSALDFNVFPGSSSGGGTDVYEDDGSSTDYLSGMSALTTLRYSMTSAGCTTYTLATSGSSYVDMVTVDREYTVTLRASPQPMNVSVNGHATTWSRTPAGDVVVELPPCSTADVQTVVVCV